MVAYTLAAISHLSSKKLNLLQIWNEQYVITPSVQNELTIDVLSVYAKLLNGAQHITYKIKTSYKAPDGRTRNRYEPREISQEDILKIKGTALYRVMELVKKIEPLIWDHIVNVDEGTNINEWTKAPRCWDALRTKLDNAGKEFAVPTELISSESEVETEINEGQQRVIDEAANYDEGVWFSINRWAKETEALTPRETSFMGQFAFMIKRNRPYTYKQARWALDLLEKSKKAGWESWEG